MTRPMTSAELRDHDRETLLIRGIVSSLRLSRLSEDSEDVRVALARLNNWLTENDGRWVK